MFYAMSKHPGAIENHTCNCLGPRNPDSVLTYAHTGSHGACFQVVIAFRTEIRLPVPQRILPTRIRAVLEVCENVIAVLLISCNRTPRCHNKLHVERICNCAI